MRLVIVPGPIDKIHRASCWHANRSLANGNARRIQGARADRMLVALSAEPDYIVSDGSNGLPKGYFRACQLCVPTEGGE